jgi:hypothetical protein
MSAAVQNADHTLSGASMSFVEMETLIDILAEKCLDLDSQCSSIRTTLHETESQVRRTRDLVASVRRQVEAGIMSAEAAVAVLSGAPGAVAQAEVNRAQHKNFDARGFIENIPARRAS